jgi:hypothetical protein
MTPKLRNFRRRMVATKRSGKREKLWRAMRILRTFTTAELAAVTEQESRNTAVTYCSELRRAGFLAAQRGNHRHHELTRYRLLRDSGPQAPWSIHRGAAIYDPNEDKEYSVK